LNDAANDLLLIHDTKQNGDVSIHTKINGKRPLLNAKFEVGLAKKGPWPAF